MLYRQIQTRAEGEISDTTRTRMLYIYYLLYVVYITYLEIDEVYAEKIKVKVLVNQQNSVS